MSHKYQVTVLVEVHSEKQLSAQERHLIAHQVRDAVLLAYMEDTLMGDMDVEVTVPYTSIAMISAN